MKAPVAAFVIVTTPVVACVTTEYVRLLPSTSEPVSVPVKVVSSVAVMDWAAASGLSLTAVILTVTVAGLLSSVPSFTLNVKLSAPVAFRLGT